MSDGDLSKRPAGSHFDKRMSELAAKLAALQKENCR